MTTATDFYIKFQPRVWLSDAALRSCSLEARGLWVDLLCLMHQAPVKGYLMTSNGDPYTTDDLKKILPLNRAKITAIMAELAQKNVMKTCSKTGFYYSQRLLQEEGKLIDYAKNGAKSSSPNRGKKNKPEPQPTTPVDDEPPPPLNPSICAAFELSALAKTGQQYAQAQAQASGLSTVFKTAWVGTFLTQFAPPQGCHPEVETALLSLWQATVDAGTTSEKYHANWYRQVFTNKVKEWHPQASPAKGKGFNNPASTISERWQDQPTGDITL